MLRQFLLNRHVKFLADSRKTLIQIVKPFLFNCRQRR